MTVISHPSGSRFGRISKASLQSSGKVARFWATLFFIADVLVSVKGLRKQEGTVVFVRYLMGAAYLPKPLAQYGYRLFRNLLPFPDVAMFIDIEPKVAIRRIMERDHKREMFETEEKLTEIRDIAKSLLSSEWVVVDNSVDGEEPFKKVEMILREMSVL